MSDSVFGDGRKNVAVMCFSGGRGGMEHDAIKIAHLLNEDCNVILFCKKNSFIHQQLVKQSTIDFIDINFSSRTFSPSMLFAVRSNIKKHDIKNVIFFGASELKTLYFSFLGFDLNVIVRHGTTKSSPKKDLLHRIIYSCVDTHVALSKHLLKNIKMIVPHHAGVEYEYIPQSFKFLEVHADRDNAHGLKMVHVGRVTGGKGQLDAVVACKILHDNDIDFSLDLLGAIDDKSYYHEIKKILDASAYSESISFKGHVENVSEYLANSDLLLFPSYGEGMPNALIEALHYGVVCITYDNTVFPEFLDMGFDLHLVESGNILQLSKVLLETSLHIDDEKANAKNNSALALAIFSPDVELESWKRLIV